jgi:DNA primase
MIPKETVAKILETAEIVDVVSDFISLKKRGANYLGLCPFHNEKRPIIYCFSC